MKTRGWRGPFSPEIEIDGRRGVTGGFETESGSTRTEIGKWRGIDGATVASARELVYGASCLHLNSGDDA